jgi:hypothetical protein
MSAAPIPVAEITAKAIRVLCREIGPVNTARFLNQFTTGFGDYTAQRDELIGEPTVDELLAELRARRKKLRQPRKSSRKNRPGPSGR